MANSHWHCDWKLFVIDVEDVQNLHIYVHVHLKVFRCELLEDIDGNDYDVDDADDDDIDDGEDIQNLHVYVHVHLKFYSFQMWTVWL